MHKLVITQKGIDFSNDILQNLNEKQSLPPFVQTARMEKIPKMQSKQNSNQPFFLNKTKTILKENTINQDSSLSLMFQTPVATKQEPLFNRTVKSIMNKQNNQVGSQENPFQQQGQYKVPRSQMFVDYNQFKKEVDKNPDQFEKTFIISSPNLYNRIQTPQVGQRPQVYSRQGAHTSQGTRHSSNIRSYQYWQQQQQLQNPEFMQQKIERKMQKTLAYMDNDVKHQQNLEQIMAKKREGFSDSVNIATVFLNDLKGSPINELYRQHVQHERRSQQRIFEIQKQKYNKMWKNVYIPGGQKEVVRQENIKKQARQLYQENEELMKSLKTPQYLLKQQNLSQQKQVEKQKSLLNDKINLKKLNPLNQVASNQQQSANNQNNMVPPVKISPPPAK